MRSYRFRWPLLVIATHREAEWRQGVAAGWKEGEPVTRLAQLHAALALGPEWQGEWVILPVPDLSDVARAAFPGLKPHQVQLVAQEAGGNPELLREILLWLDRQPSLFVAGDKAGGLTSRAEAEIRQRRFRLEDLVADRFTQLGEHVRQALGWSRPQGARFLAVITKGAARRVDPAVGEAVIDDALRAAEDPHCIVQFVRDAGRRNLAAFRQRIFWEVAREHLGFNPEEQTAVESAIRDVLTEWIRSGEIDLLPTPERLDALLIARRALRPAEADSPQRWASWAQAMIRLTRRYAAEFLWDQALDAARDLSDARRGVVHRPPAVLASARASEIAARSPGSAACPSTGRESRSANAGRRRTHSNLGLTP